jgi:GAF domain
MSNTQAQLDVLRAIRPTFAAPTPQRALLEIARRLAPMVGDYVVMDEVVGGRLEHVAIVNAREELDRLAHRWSPQSPAVRALSVGDAVCEAKLGREDAAFAAKPVCGCIAAPVRIEGDTVAVLSLVSCTRAYGQADVGFAVELADWIAVGLQGHRARATAAQVVRTGSTMREYLRAPPAVRLSSGPPPRVDMRRALDEDLARAADALAAATDRLASSSVLEPIDAGSVRSLADEAHRIGNVARDLIDWAALEEDAPVTLQLVPLELAALATRIASRAAVARPLRIEIIGSGTLIADARLLPTAFAHLVRAVSVRTHGEITLRAELTNDALIVDLYACKRVTPDPAAPVRAIELSSLVARRILQAHGGSMDARASSLRAQVPRALTDESGVASSVVRRI